MSYTSRLGSLGEDMAVEWLRTHGFVIRDRNWRSGHCELDVVAERGGTIHFVEVKLRRKDGLTLPEDAVTLSKQTALLKAADAYMKEFGLTADCQIDVIAVDYYGGDSDVRYIPDITVSNW